MSKEGVSMEVDDTTENIFASGGDDFLADDSEESTNLVLAAENDDAIVPEVVDNDTPAATNENLDLIAKCQKAYMNISNGFFEFSALLYEINEKKLWKINNYKNLEEFTATEVGILERKAYYYINIHRLVLYLQNTLESEIFDKYEKVMRALGWTKVSKIAEKFEDRKSGVKLITEENAESFLGEISAKDEKGKLPTVEEIKTIINKERSLKTEDEQEDLLEAENQTVKPYTKMLKYGSKDKERVDLAREMINKTLSNNGKEPNFTKSILAIIENYITNAQASEGKPVDLNESLSRLEELLNLDIVALKRDSDNVVFGKETAFWIQNEMEQIPNPNPQLETVE